MDRNQGTVVKNKDSGTNCPNRGPGASYRGPYKYHGVNCTDTTVVYIRQLLPYSVRFYKDSYKSLYNRAQHIVRALRMLAATRIGLASPDNYP